MSKQDDEKLNEEIKAIAKSFEPRYKSEIEAVKSLGESIGYGNMMSIASTLWAIKLKKDWGITSGAFIPTISGFMKKREAVKAEDELNRKIEHFKRMGFAD